MDIWRHLRELNLIIEFLEIMFHNPIIAIRIAKGDDLMSSLDQARQTQIDNIQKKTGKSLDALTAIVRKSGLSKHGEIRQALCTLK